MSSSVDILLGTSSYQEWHDVFDYPTIGNLTADLGREFTMKVEQRALDNTNQILHARLWSGLVDHLQNAIIITIEEDHYFE